MNNQLPLKSVDLSNGETYAYVEAGESSKVLLLIHGAVGTFAPWVRFIPQFSDVFRVIALDLRGHGQSSYNKLQVSHDDHAEDVKLFLDKLGISKVFVCGWSMGGGIAMKLAAQYPEYVEKLILHNSMGVKGVTLNKMNAEGKPTTEKVLTEEEALNHPRALLLAALASQMDADKIKAIQRASIFNGRNKLDDERLDMYVKEWSMCRCIQRLPYLANIYNISDESNGVVAGTGEILKIKCPVLILHGEKDIIVPKEEAEYLKKLLKDKAELKLFPEAGHAVMEDYPGEFVQSVKEFCLKNE